MRIVDCEQNSPEWISARCGLATASEFSSIMAKGKGLTRASYLRRIVGERLSGVPSETYRNATMDRGKEHEPLARGTYEMLTGQVVTTVGIGVIDELRVGASPDGLIGEHGGLEIKSVIPNTHVETVERGGVPPEHIAQIQGNMWVFGRSWWDFVSYCFEMPVGLQAFVVRCWRDDEYIANLASEVARFNADADKLIHYMNTVEMVNTAVIA